MIHKILLLLTITAVFAISQPYNNRMFKTQINDFKADSLKTTQAFAMGDAEGLRVNVYANDTTSAGYASDAIVFFYALQYGEITTNYLNEKDTAWIEPSIVIDTFRMAAANISAENSYTTDIETQPALSICTTSVSGYAFQSRTVQPYRYPVARIKIKGVTGNETVSPLRLKIEVTQPKYTRVNIGQDNQPND